MAGGDIGPVYEPTEQFAELIAPVLAQADLRFGQCERIYSERGRASQFSLGPSGQHARVHPRMASVWKAVAKAVISKSGIERVSFLPTFINHRAQPYVLAPDDPKFQEILEFTEWVSDQHPHKFRVEGNEVVVDTSGA